MLIKNFTELATSTKKRDSLSILEAGLEVANPENILPSFISPTKITIGNDTLDLTKFSNIYTAAFGKAADSMTRAINSIIPVKAGIIVIPKGSKSRIKGKKFQIFNSGHPRPDKISIKAAKETEIFT